MCMIQYWYELYLDDLPMWGMVGEILRDEASGQMVHVSLPTPCTIFTESPIRKSVLLQYCN